MQSLYEIILKRFLASSIVQVIAIGVTLVVAIFMFNQYQANKSKEELQKISETTFKEISDRTAHNIQLSFEKAFSLARQIQTQAHEIFANLENYSSSSLEIIHDGAFFRNDIGGLSSVYTTNVENLGKRERKALEQLSLLVPLMRDGVERESDLISAAWINIGSRYAARYPYINVSENVPASLDVTDYRFYYEADPEHNPERKMVFLDLYHESWAMGLGEIAVILVPLYVHERFIGVVGLNITVDSVAESLLKIRLPHRSYMMLLDRDNTLISSSDETRNMAEFQVNSFYHHHKNPPAQPFDTTEDMRVNIDSSREDKLSYEAAIPMTNMKVMLCANKADIFETIEQVYQEGKQIGYYLILFIFLFYALFYTLMFRVTKKLAMYIASPVKKLVEFSKSLGTESDLELKCTNIEEFEILNSNLIEANRSLSEMLIIDGLTKLYNQRKLAIELDKTPKGVLFGFCIDHFKSVNNTYGNEGGDQVLKHIAAILDSMHSDTRRVYKIQTDSFAILEKGMGEPDAEMIERFRHILLSEPCVFDEIEIEYSITFGVSTHEGDFAKTIKQTELAIDAAKQFQRGKYIIYNNEMKISQEFEANLIWGKRVKEAINEDRFFPVFQPIYNLKTQRVEKFESLVRLRYEDEVISPALFLGPAKNTGLLNTITRLMIRKVFAVASRYKEFEFSINLSFSDFHEADMFAYIENACKTNNIQPARIVFEVLETEELISEAEQINVFHRLKEMGFKIAIDDFGSGYSNFSHILQIHTDYIKIDGQFIKNIHQDENSYIITKTIVNFAHSINTRTIAEFVSSQESKQKIEELGVFYAQGYEISPPVEEEKIKTFLSNEM